MSNVYHYLEDLEFGKLMMEVEFVVFIIPQTVPKSPTKGAVDPTEARNIMERSSLSISRDTVTCITRSRRSLRPDCPDSLYNSPLADDRRHSRIAAANTAVIGALG